MPNQKPPAKRESPLLRKLHLAVEAGKKGNYPLAVKTLGELISETDAPSEAWLLLGRSLHALKDYSRALAAFNDYMRLRPKAAEGYLFAGRTYLTLGMAYRAVPFLRKALEFSPGDSQIMALLGTAYIKSKHSQAAVDILEEAVNAAPDNKRIYRAYLNSLLIRGIRLCGIEEYEPGLQMLRFVLLNGEEAGLGESPILRLELGRAARETGKLDEALEHYTAALKLTGDDRRIRWSLVSVLMALGKNTEARKEIEKIRSRDAGVPELPWNSELIDLFMIRSLLEAGEWKRAAESCRNQLRREGGSPMIHALYAEALRNLRNYEAAHNHLRRALEQEPKNLEFWYADILVSWEGNDYVSLKRALNMAKNLGGDKDIVNRFAVLCQAQFTDDSRGKIILLQSAIRELGPEPELMYTLADSYLKEGFLEEALSWFKKTILLKNGHEKAWLGSIAAAEAILARGSRAMKTTENLGELYESYLAKWPDNLSIRRERALFLVKTFEYGEAAPELEKLLAWEPSNPSLRRVLAYAYRKTGRYREAAVFLKSLLKEKPGDIDLLIEYSGCLERTGAANYAVSVLEKARELFHKLLREQENADISLALGILSFRKKNNERAFDYFREAAAINKKDPRAYEWMALLARKNNNNGDWEYYEKEAQKRKKSKK